MNNREIYFITFATDRDKAKILENSCKLYNIPLIILGLNDKWEGFGTKFIKIRDFLKNSKDIHSNDLILFNDGYDTICQSDLSSIKQKINEVYTPTKILISAEFYLWPPPIFQLKEYFEKLTPNSKYRYPCSGQYLGSKIDLISMFDTINIKPDQDDQEAVVKYCYSLPYKIQLDTKCQLFQSNLFLLENEESHYKNKDKKFKYELNDDLRFVKENDKVIVENLYTKTRPCFIHANGPPKEYIINFFNSYVKPIKKGTLNEDKVLPKALVIVMPDRKEYVNSVFSTYNIPYDDFDAVKGKNFSYQELYEKGIIDRPSIDLTLGEIGCYMSHAKAMSKLDDKDLNKIMIFEDDVRVPNYLTGKWIGDLILESLKKVPKNCDVLYLGRCYDNCDQAEPINDMIVKVNNPLCMHAYIMFNKGYRKIKNQFFPIKDAVDRFLVNKIKDGTLTAYACNPPLFMQNNYLRSNVQKKEINFTPVCTEDHKKTHIITKFNTGTKALDLDDKDISLFIGKLSDRNNNYKFDFKMVSIVIIIVLVLLLIFFFLKSKNGDNKKLGFKGKKYKFNFKY